MGLHGGRKDFPGSATMIPSQEQRDFFLEKNTGEQQQEVLNFFLENEERLRRACQEYPLEITLKKKFDFRVVISGEQELDACLEWLKETVLGDQDTTKGPYR